MLHCSVRRAEAPQQSRMIYPAINNIVETTEIDVALKSDCNPEAILGGTSFFLLSSDLENGPTS